MEWSTASIYGPAVGTPENPLLGIAGDCVDPQTMCSARDHGPTQQLASARDLLKAGVGSLGTRSVTVHDLVRNAANALGGVHIGPPQTSTDWHLKSTMISLARDPVSDALAPVRTLRAIGRIALRGLRPLIEKADAAG